MRFTLPLLHFIFLFLLAFYIYWYTAQFSSSGSSFFQAAHYYLLYSIVSFLSSIKPCLFILSLPIWSNMLIQNRQKIYAPAVFLFSPPIPPSFHLSLSLFYLFLPLSTPTPTPVPWLILSLTFTPNVHVPSSSIDFFILSMSTLPSPSPLVTSTSLDINLLFFLNISPSFANPPSPPRHLHPPHCLTPPSPPHFFLFTRSPCHRAKPAYLLWNKSTSSHSHFPVVSFFFIHCNPFSHHPQELIKHGYKLYPSLVSPPAPLFFFPLSLSSQSQMMDGWLEWVPAVM